VPTYYAAVRLELLSSNPNPELEVSTRVTRALGNVRTIFVTDLEARTVWDRRTVRTDGPDPQCGLLGRLRNKYRMYNYY